MTSPKVQFLTSFYLKLKYNNIPLEHCRIVKITLFMIPLQEDVSIAPMDGNLANQLKSSNSVENVEISTSSQKILKVILKRESQIQSMKK